ncbi:MAG: methyltransferase domain-containing protein [Solirubrobacterales bacterium]|nr:methyltransferase domain-containing protein [Solirubrobacterales bacterium]
MITSRQPAVPAAVAAHYDGLDAYYRSLWGEHVHHGLWSGPADRAPVEIATRGLAEYVIALARIEPGDRVVDVGCGYGATSRLLAREHGARVTGLTLSAAQAAYAVSVGGRPGDPEILVRDWRENGLPDGEADAVVAIECLSHMPDKPRVFAELARVLKPGARLVLTDWLACEQRRPWRDRALLRPICDEGRLPSMHTAAEYGELLTGAGFELLRFEDLSRRVSRTWPIIVRRALARALRDPEARRFLLDRGNPDRIFALTVPRLMAAYATRAMVQGLFVAQRTGAAGGGR